MENVIYVTLELDEYYHFSKVTLDPAIANTGTCEGIPVLAGDEEDDDGNKIWLPAPGCEDELQEIFDRG